MKKALYGTTALVAGSVVATAASAAEPLQLGLGGYYQTAFGFGDIDSEDGTDYGATNVVADGEVHFKGKTTLDNGVTFGVQIELEAFTSGDQIDENYLFIEGSFGRFVIGGENTAAYMTQIAGPNVGVPVNSGWVTIFNPPPTGQTTGFRTPGLSTYGDLSNDDHGITYYSPRFGGFQIAGSFVPSPNISGDGQNQPADENTQANNLFSVGGNFVQTFGGVDIGVAAGYRQAEADDSSGSDDPSMISFGGNIGFAGFTVGGSYLAEDSDRSTDGEAWEAGVSYGTGPWTVGATYFTSEVEGTAGGGDDEMTAIGLGVEYALGPGVTASLAGLYSQWDTEDNIENEAYTGLVRVRLGF